MRRLLPHDYYRHFVASAHCRPDSRALDAFRPVAVSPNAVSSACGSAFVTLGGCKVLAAAKCEISVPPAVITQQQDDHSIIPPSTKADGDIGYLVPNVELPPLCDASKFRSGPPGAYAQSLSQTLDNICRRCPPIDLSALCISPGLAVWVIYVDFYCVSYDGSVLDACLLALAAVLKTLRLPAVDCDPELGTVRLRYLPRTSPESSLDYDNGVGDDIMKQDALCRETREEFTSLEIVRLPLATTFVCLEGELLVDPTAEEEGLVEQTHVVVVDALAAASNSNPLTRTALKKPNPSAAAAAAATEMNERDLLGVSAKRDIIAVLKSGGEALPLDMILKSIQMARKRGAGLISVLSSC